MCGFAGFVDFSHLSNQCDLEHMVNAIHHRGPDDKGTIIIETDECKIGLGHARLSIIDLSVNGHQPMHYKNLNIVFNGEIYNFKELKTELIKLGHQFLSESDTEVILHAYDEWGMDAVKKFIGMFAFCIYDSRANSIIFCRDRAGVKPLYYYRDNHLILFGSELKALMAHPRFLKDINVNVLPEYFQYGYISTPKTIFQNSFKLEAGHWAIFDISTRQFSKTRYWNIYDFYARPKLSIEFEEAKQHLQELLQSAFLYRMVSDVPVGVFLSGGIDSTAVTAILQSQMSDRLKTFTIGFNEGNNEAPYAKAIAQYIGTDHTEQICTTKEAQDIIPVLPFYYDEPFGDSSAIPTILVSRLAAQSVKVALSADAGDEVFCGYDSYFKLNQYNEVLNKIPDALKNPIKFIGKLAANNWRIQNEAIHYKINSFFDALSHDNYEQILLLYHMMHRKPDHYIMRFMNEEALLNGDVKQNIKKHYFTEPLEEAMATDYQFYLQDDILTKVDRATMSVSIEGREPLIDHRIVEFVAQLPYEFKYNKGSKSGKRILKDIVYEYVPRELVDRPKAGFSVPIYSWLRGDLKYLLNEYLSEHALNQSGIFNTKFVSKELRRFHDNKMHYSPMIWYLLMFQMWHAKWISYDV